MGSLIKNPIYIGSVQRAVGGRVGFLIIRESLLVKVVALTQSYLTRQCVSPTINDSAAAGGPDLADAYLGGAPQLVFIDSSHQYKHTLDELNLWYPHVAPGGLVALHDTSVFAKTFDGSNCGGVGKAVDEWTSKNNVQKININGFVSGGSPGDYPYLDGCGLTLIQKNP